MTIMDDGRVAMWRPIPTLTANQRELFALFAGQTIELKYLDIILEKSADAGTIQPDLWQLSHSIIGELTFLGLAKQTLVNNSYMVTFEDEFSLIRGTQHKRVPKAMVAMMQVLDWRPE